MTPPAQITTTRSAAAPLHPRQVCDGDCQKPFQSPAQNLRHSPQPTKTKHLKPPQIINRHFGKSPSRAPHSGETTIAEITPNRRLPISTPLRNPQKPSNLQPAENKLTHPGNPRLPPPPGPRLRSVSLGDIGPMDRYSDLRARAVDFVQEFAPAGPVLILAPVRLAAEEVARTACSETLLGVHARAFRDFVMELAAAGMNRRELVPVGRFVREALGARVTADSLGRHELTYLAPVAGFPGFPRALTDTFEELRLNPADLARLSDIGDSGPDLARLLDAYSRELAARGLADHADRVRLAQEAVAARPRDLCQMAIVTLDVMPRTQLERELLRALMRTARARLDLRLGAGPLEPASSLESLQRYLFSGDPVPPREDDRSVVIFSTSGEALECVEIARHISAAAERGVPFDEMAILLRSPERYQPLVAEGLRRAAIPVHCARGSLRPDVAGRSFLALLHCVEDGLSASRFAEYLSLGQMPEPPAGPGAKNAEPLAPAAWERLLVDAAVIGGLARWEKRLAGLREEFHRRYREARDEEPLSALERFAWERKIASVESLDRKSVV